MSGSPSFIFLAALGSWWNPFAQDAPNNDQSAKSPLAQNVPNNDQCGPDVSTYQGAVDWKKVAQANPPFAIAKASEGPTYVDDQFHTNWQQIKQNNIRKRGAYHFGHPNQDAKTQALHFMNTVGQIGANDFVALDIESASRRRLNATSVGRMLLAPQDVAQWAKDFVDTIAATGVHKSQIFIYTGSWFWDSQAGGSDIVSDHPLWISSYTSSEPKAAQGWSEWKLWQFTDRASIPGINGGVDCSKFK